MLLREVTSRISKDSIPLVFISFTPTMAALRALVVSATMLAMLQVAMAKSYIVGNPNGGWDMATNLKAWVTPKKFHPGDSLTFAYGSSHNVMEVTKSDYDTCTTTSPIQTFTSGNTIISLKAAGKLYFICGVPGHCDNGMKLEVDVSAAATTPPEPESQSSTSASAPISEAPSTGPAPTSETGITEPPAVAPAPSSATHSSIQLVKVAAGVVASMAVVLALLSLEQQFGSYFALNAKLSSAMCKMKLP